MQTKRWNVKSGARDDLPGIRVRSGWEADCIRWLKYQNIVWEYEPKRFTYPVKRGTKSYVPDLWLPKKKLYIEIKGSISATDRTRIRRFKKYYPEEYAQLVGIPGTKNTEAARFFDEMEIPIYAYYLDLNKKYKDIIEYWNT